MKVALLRPRFDTFLFVPSLGLGYISSYLKQFGIDAIIIDALRDNLSEEQILKKLKDYAPDVVGISCLSPLYCYVKTLAIMLKKEGYKVVIGGVHPTFMPKETLTETGADYVICGEGEIAWRELATNNFSRPVKGVYSLENIDTNNTKYNFADIITNLDELPFPDWQELKPHKYKYSPMGQIAKNFPIAPIMPSRGCAYACTFCSSPNFYQRKIRFRSAENVIEEIKYLKKDFKIKEIQMMDDNLIYNEEFAVKFCNLLIKHNIKIDWTCQNGIRADKLNLELAKLMKKAGCYMVAIGIESAHPTILKNIRKGETIEQISKSIEIAHKAGILVQGNFILGLPGETKETLQTTLDYSLKSNIDRGNINMLVVLPGSQLWHDLKGNFEPNFSTPASNYTNWEPPGLTKEFLEKALPEAIKRFWLRPRILWNVVKLVRIKQLPIIFNRLISYKVFKKILKKIATVNT